MSCIHAEWAILGDDNRNDVGAASRRLTFLSKYRDSPKYSNNRVILRPDVEINRYDILGDIFSGARGMLKSLRNHKTGSGSLRCLPLLSQPTRSLNGGLLARADTEKKIKSLMMIK